MRRTPSTLRNGPLRALAALLGGFMLSAASMDSFACNSNGIGGGNWSAAATWNAASCTTRPPGAAEAVVILNGDTVNIDTTPITIASLTLNGTGRVNYTGGAKTLTVNGNVTMNNTSVFTVTAAGGTNTHVLNLTGDFTNNSTSATGQDFVGATSDTVTVNFTKAGAGVTQSIKGGGTVMKFNRIVVNMGTNTADIVEVDSTATNFSLTAGNLTITKGTFKVTAPVTVTAFIADPAMGANAGLWVNGGNVSSTPATTTYAGLMRVSAGTLTIGNAAEERLLPDVGSTTLIEGGTVIIAGRFVRQATGEAWTFNMSGGTLTVGTSGNSSTLATFLIEAAQTFVMSGGTIIIQDSGSTNLAYQNNSTAGGTSVTGGTIQLGSSASAAAATLLVNSSVPVGNLVVDATTNVKTAGLNTNALTVLDNVTINGSGGGVGSTLATNNLNITLNGTVNSGTWTNNGIFTAGTGTVTFSGTKAQTIAGSSATTFNNLTVNKASGGSNVTELTVNTSALATSPVVGGTLTLTAGTVDTRTNSRAIVMGTAAAAVAGTLDATRHVNGCIRKNYTAAATGYTFPTGDGTNYTPLIQTFATNTGAISDVTACVTAADHPQVITPVATTGIDVNHSVNRYWSLTANQGGTGTPTGVYRVSLTYVNTGTGVDNDSGNTPATYIIERYVSASGAWFPTTISGTPTTTNAQTSSGAIPAVQTTGYGDYAVGNSLAGLTPAATGRFNAFETTTTSGAIIGRIKTRIAGAGSTSVDVVAINANRNGLDTTPYTNGGTCPSTGSRVLIYLLDASDDSGALDTNGCRASWKFSNGALVSTVSPAGGTPTAAADACMTFAAGNASRKTASFTLPTNAFPKQRLFIQDSAATTLIGCSSDPFAVRPKELQLTARDADWRTTASTNPTNASDRTLNNSGGRVHGAGSNFKLFATAVNNSGATTSNYSTNSANYGNGTDATIKGAPSAVSGSPTCATLPTSGCVQATSAAALTVGGWSDSATAGVAMATASYGEAGTFNYQVEDVNFARIDIGDGTPATGTTGYTIPQSPAAGPATVEIGAFVPDNFLIGGANTPLFMTYGMPNATTSEYPEACTSRQFTYIGQTFWYATLPTATITARNASNGTTTYYSSAGGTAALAASGVVETYPATDNGLALIFGTNTPVQLGPFVSGAATYTAKTKGTSSVSGITYTRSTTTPKQDFNSGITLSVQATESSYAGTTGNPGQGANPALTSNSLSFGTVGFDQGAAQRYGRMRLINASGSELVDLSYSNSVSPNLRAEYYNGTGFATNTLDNCTKFQNSNFAFITGSESGGITLPPTGSPNMSNSKISYSATPLALTNGVGTLTITKPSAVVSGSLRMCLDLDSSDGACSATPASKPWLQGPWGSASYIKDPNARISFGLYGAQPRNYIFFRENY